MVYEQKRSICSRKGTDGTVREQNCRFCSLGTIDETFDEQIGRFCSRGGSADEPFVAGEEGEELGGEGAAEEGQQGYQWDGIIDGDGRRGCVAADDEVGDGDKVEDVHQVHAEGQLGEGSDQGGRLFLPNAGEDQEEAERGEKDVGSAEFPGPFDYRRGDGFSRDGLHPEGPAREDGADNEA